MGDFLAALETRQGTETSSPVLLVTEAVTLLAHQNVVRCSTLAEEDYSIILPPVSGAKNRGLYSILLRVLEDDETITITDQGDSEDWTDLEMTAVGDHAVLYSDGIKWFVLTSVITVPE